MKIQTIDMKQMHNNKTFSMHEACGKKKKEKKGKTCDHVALFSCVTNSQLHITMVHTLQAHLSCIHIKF